MKQLFLFAVLTFSLFSCSGNQKKTEASTSTTFEVDDFLAVADQNVDKTITLVGYVTHTCEHSGKRCFVVGESQTTSIRVEAKGEIDQFTPELIGSKIAITGIIKEQHLDNEYIDGIETEVKQMEKEEDASEEDCAAELSNINDMRQWMKDNNKDFYIIYYMDGQSFEVLE